MRPFPDRFSYAAAHSAEEPAALAWLRRQTHLRCLYPQMLTPPLQGRLLSLLSRTLRPRLALELGTFTGYSALCLAEGLAEGGRLHCIERDPEREPLIREGLARAGTAEQVELHFGLADEWIARLPGPWDLIYLDADKASYPRYADFLIPRLRPGGLLLADNVLWKDKVLGEAIDKETQGVAAFNEQIARDPRLLSVLLPFGDGLSIALRLPSEAEGEEEETAS
jgi:predicted O-methyltransferase YrrM